MAVVIDDVVTRARWGEKRFQVCAGVGDGPWGQVLLCQRAKESGSGESQEAVKLKQRPLSNQRWALRISLSPFWQTITFYRT